MNGTIEIKLEQIQHDIVMNLQCQNSGEFALCVSRHLQKFYNKCLFKRIRKPHNIQKKEPTTETTSGHESRGSVVVSKHGLYVGSLGSIPTAVTTMTAAGGDAEHVSLNH